MAGEYIINLFDGTALTTVYPRETDGPNNTSTPRPIINVDDVAGTFTLEGDVTFRFVPGFTFTVSLSGGGVNDGTFTVAPAGSSLTGTDTLIPVVEPVAPNPPATTLGRITYSIPATTVMSLPGRETINYGEIQNEDFIHLMENFAEITANIPSLALSLEGMQFWSKDEQIMYRRGAAAWTSTINLAPGDEVLGLPATPSATGAASKEYVDTEVGSVSSALTAHTSDGTIHFTEASISHLNIQDIGTNSHAQIDSHIADSTLHFTEASIDHLNILNIGTNSHAQIDSHIADSTLHFTEASISHLNIQDIGSNSHAQIDTHIADSTIHFTQASISITASQVSDFSSAADARIAVASIDDLADVDTTTVTPVVGEVLKWNGSNWVPGTDTSGAPLPQYEEFVAGASQTIFNTTITTLSNTSGGNARLQVYVNGIYQLEGATKAYTVTGANQITFNAAVPSSADVVMYAF